jgi:hypothetical protein
MPVDQAQSIRVVCVPDPEQFAGLRFFRHQLHPSVVSEAKHEFECVNVTLKKPPQRQASPTNRTQDLAKGQASQPCPPNLTGRTAVKRPDSCNAATSEAG